MLRIFKKIDAYSVLIVCFALITGLLVYARIFFGVDFTDEAYYIGTSYRFILGDKPFVDEQNFVMQVPALMMYPLLKLYVSVFGNIDGIILYFRFVYLLFTGFVSLLIYYILKGRISWQNALIISLTSVAFIPFSIANFSYNTLASNFFLMGCFIGLAAVESNKDKVYLFISGLCHGLAIVSYPTLAFPVLFYTIALALVLCLRKRQILLRYIPGILLVILMFTPVLYEAGLHNLKISYDYVSSIGAQGGGLAKIKNVFIDLWINYLYKLQTIFILIAICVGIAINEKKARYVFLCFPVIILFLSASISEHFVSMKYISYYGLLAPYFLIFVKDNKFARQLFYVIWIPSFVAGIATGWTSANGYINSALGLLPASLVTSIFIVMSFTKTFAQNEMTSFRYKLQLIPSILILLILIYFQYNYVYRDDQIADLKTKVSFGPYRGLYTTVEKDKYMEDLSRDIESVKGNGKKILFYDYFPAGYLFTSMRPATNTLWLRSKSDKPSIDRYSTIKYYARNNTKPDVVFKIKKMFLDKKSNIWTIDYPVDDSIDQFVKEGIYEEYLSNDNYTIFTFSNK